MKKIYSLFLILLIAIGCYEDKGNYTYKDIQEIVINDLDESLNSDKVTVGELIEIKPIITPDITEVIKADPNRYTFKWIINGEARPEWNKMDFAWVADRPTQLDKDYEKIIFEVTDTRYGIKYTSNGEIKINPEFIASRGYIILSEDESGNSKLHYMKYLNMDGERPDPVDPTSTIKYPLDTKMYLNVYETQNGGTLGKGPISIQQHFIYWPTGTQYCIFQESGAVDIEASGLKKESEFKSSFEDGSYPEGTTYLKNGSMMKWLDVMSDQKGRLFSRLKYDKNLYNTGTFIKDPIRYKEVELEECEVYRNPYNRYRGAFIFDKKNGQFLFMFDGEADDSGNSDHKSAGSIISIPPPATGIPDDCRSFDDFKNCEILALTVDYDGTKFYVLYRNEYGKVVLQTTTMSKEDGVPAFNNTAMESHEISNVPENLFKVSIPLLYAREYIFFIAENKLYLLDIDSGVFRAELYYTTESKITAFYATDQDRTAIICTEDGFFYEIDATNAKNKISSKVNDELKLIYKTGGFGKVIDVNFCEDSKH